MANNRLLYSKVRSILAVSSTWYPTYVKYTQAHALQFTLENCTSFILRCLQVSEMWRLLGEWNWFGQTIALLMRMRLPHLSKLYRNKKTICIDRVALMSKDHVQRVTQAQEFFKAFFLLMWMLWGSNGSWKPCELPSACSPLFSLYVFLFPWLSLAWICLCEGEGAGMCLWGHIGWAESV